jgi:RNA polymerase primary sigma factor
MLAVVPAERKLGALFRLAIRSGALDAVVLHIRRGEPINGRDGAGLTPLMLAAVHGQLDVAAGLIDAGADHDLVSPEGRTAKELAVELGHLSLAELLSTPGHAPSLIAADPEPICAGLIRENDERGSDHSGTAAAAIAEIIETPPPAPLILLPGLLETTDEEGSRAATDGFPEEMNGWVADDAVVAPRHDVECVSSARNAQRVMSTHRRVSDDIDWSDVELELPEIRVQAPSVSLGEMPAVEELIANGLVAGFVGSSELSRALEADCGWQIERAQDVLQRVLDDLAILSGPWAPTGQACAVAEPDVLNDAIDALCADLPEPDEPSAAFASRVRRGELIKREDEERIGRHMDSALGTLTRALASLPEAGWKRAFPSDALPVSQADEADDEFEGAPDQARDDDAVENGDQMDFAGYVALVRGGMPEYGREAMVPRPRPAELTRLLVLASDMEADVGRAAVTSIAAYEKARDQLVCANLRLAMSVAYGYRYRELPLEDLIQDANLGLMRAAEKFDFRRGFKFSTYATAWIRQSILRGLADTARLIRVPVHMVEKINAVGRARRDLDHGRERPVGIDEIAERLSLSPEAVRRIVRSDPEVLSLEECGKEGVQGTPDPLDIVDSEADPYGTASRQSLSRLIERMLADCKEKERDVLVLRFGLSGLDSMTLEEIGQMLEVTRERIRQIESKALTRFRQPSRHDQLSPFAGATSLSDY